MFHIGTIGFGGECRTPALRLPVVGPDPDTFRFSLREADVNGQASLETRRPSAASLAVALCIAALGLWVHRHTPGYALLGLDTYLQIIESRVESVGELAQVVSRPLAGDRILARFYRPLQSLSIAIDHAVYGIEPHGYHLTTMAIFAAVVLLVFAAARRLLGGGIGPPALAALFFALHPCLLNVVPAPCRRSELLVAALLLLLLCVAPTGAERRIRLRLWLTGGIALLAGAAKDIGVMAVGLMFLHQLLYRRAAPGRGRLGTAAGATLPALLGAGVYLAARTAVLGGLGGYPESPQGPMSYGERMSVYGPAWIEDLLLPHVFAPVAWLLPAEGREWSVLAALALAGLVVAAWVATGVAAVRTGEESAGSAARCGLLSAAWLAPSVLLLGLMKFYGPWYTVLPAAGLSLGLAGLLHAGLGLRARGGRGLRAAGTGLAAVPLLVGVCALRFSPAWTAYSELSGASEALRSTLESIDEQLPEADPIQPIYVQVMPVYLEDGPLDRPRLQRVTTMMVQGVEAYAQLRFPELNPRAVHWAERFDPDHDGARIVVDYVNYRGLPQQEARLEPDN